MAFQDKTLTGVMHDWYATQSGLPTNASLNAHKIAYYNSQGFGGSTKPLSQIEREWLQYTSGRSSNNPYELWSGVCAARSIAVGKSINECMFNYFTSPSSISNPGNAMKFVAASSQSAGRLRVSTAIDNFTVAFWLYIDSYPGATSRVFYNGDSPNHFGYDITLSTTGILTLDMVFVDATCKTTTALSTGTWYHVTVRRNAGTSQFYLNATADGPTSSATPNAISALSSTGLAATFTASGVATGGYSNITMDDVRIYDRVLSTTEITNLYNYGLSMGAPDISSANLMAWWKLDETSGNPVDSSGNGNTLTNNNTATFVTGIVPIK